MQTSRYYDDLGSPGETSESSSAVQKLNITFGSDLQVLYCLKRVPHNSINEPRVKIIMAATISRNKYKKFADSETQLDIDEAILDYLLYTATQDLLDQELAQKYDSTAAAGRQRAEIVFQMVECQSSLYQT